MGLSPAAPQAGGDKRHWHWGQKALAGTEGLSPLSPAKGTGVPSSSLPCPVLPASRAHQQRGCTQHRGQGTAPTAPAPQETSPKKPPLLSPGPTSALVAPWGQPRCCPGPAPCRMVLGGCSQAPSRVRPPAPAQRPWARTCSVTAGPLPCASVRLTRPCLEPPELIPKRFIKNVLGRRPVNPHGELTFVVNLCFLSNMIFSVTFMFDDFKSPGLPFCSAQVPTNP